MLAREKGKLGGIATRDGHLTICPLCGSPRQSQYFTKTGRKGGNTTLKRHGHGFYSRIGSLGGRGNTREKRNGRDRILPEPVPAIKEAR
ncbi:MAG TPA: hypothetical protein VMW50_03330 [Dehalococcoidia bacterium]|nr:hypothetical protein [Dehalococcoidia bacterium]